jgi:hypothetical protein
MTDKTISPPVSKKYICFNCPVWYQNGDLEFVRLCFKMNGNYRLHQAVARYMLPTIESEHVCTTLGIHTPVHIKIPGKCILKSRSSATANYLTDMVK